jgi:general secretion pathway protein F
MSTSFNLVARTAQGTLTSVRIHAADAAAATALLSERGMQVLRCDARSGDERASMHINPQRLTLAKKLDIALFAQELASLVIAGLSILEALNTLADKEAGGPRRILIKAVIHSISEGLALSIALERAGEFPPLLIATVTASEQTGDIATALLRYSEHQQGLQALRDKVIGAAIYPMLLLGVGTLVVFFLLGVVVPKFAILIASSRAELPWSSRLLMSWGQFASGKAHYLFGLAALAIGAVVVAWRTAANAGFKSGWIEQLPFVGPLARQFRHAQLYRSTGMLLRGGIAAPRALQLSASLLGVDDQRRLQLAITLVQEGKDISSALKGAQLADHIASSMLAVAQRTGSLSEVLERIAMFYEARLRRSIDVGSRLFEPILMIFIGLVIGAIVVLMYLPIFDLASSLD